MAWLKKDGMMIRPSIQQLYVETVKRGAIFAIVLVAGMKTLACDCSGYANYSNAEMTIEWYNSYPLVFSAVVDSVKTEAWFEHTVYLSIDRVFKGNVSTQVELSPPHFNTSCSFDFTGQEGITYLFYAEYDEQGAINSHFCDGSKRLYTHQELDTLSQYPFYAKKWRHELELLQEIANNQNGDYRFTYSNGAIQNEGKLQNGLPHGHWTYYNYFGEKIAEGHYDEGKKVGVWVEYMYAYNQPKTENSSATLTFFGYHQGMYKENKRDGVWKTYAKNGEFEGSTRYEAGRALH